MTELDTKIQIDELLMVAYDETMEMINAIEDAHIEDIYKTLVIRNNDVMGLVAANMNYYIGCFEGAIFTKFLHKFDRTSTPLENAYIKDLVQTKFDVLKKKIMAISNDEKLKKINACSQTNKIRLGSRSN